jgi:hypothetical protein
VGLADCQNFPYRVIPQEKKVITIKGEEFKVFPAYKPSLAILLNGISRRYQAIAA